VVTGPLLASLFVKAIGVSGLLLMAAAGLLLVIVLVHCLPRLLLNGVFLCAQMSID
jgi:hypothetical protein